MAQIFPIDFEEKLTMAQDDYILFSDSEDGNKIKKAQYKNLKGEKGDPGTNGTNGQDGAAATITVGSTTTGTPGSSASVTNSGTSSAAVLDFTIPQGAKGEPGQDGDDGAAATITVGTTTTLPAGSSATVTNSGTSNAAVLNFGIPQGATGTQDAKVFALSSTSDLTNAQAAYDWYASGKEAVILYSGRYYYFKGTGAGSVYFAVNEYTTLDNTDVTSLVQKTLTLVLSGTTVTSISSWNMSLTNYNVLRTGKNYGTPYTPQYDGSPATKKYVDDKSTVVSSTAPSPATEGMLWYDTTNDVLKTYDGANWNAAGGGSGDVTGPASSTDGDVVVFDGTTGKLIKDGSVALSTLSAGASAGATAVQPGDIGTAAACNTGTSSGNVPILDSNGKLATSTLPGVALTDTFTVSTSADLTSLSSADQGDIAIVTTENKTYVLSQAPYSTAANWKQILSPTGGVTSWNGQTGAVTYTAPVTSVNGSTGAVTVLESQTKVFTMPEVGDSVSDILTWLGAGKVAILKDGNIFYQIVAYNTVYGWIAYSYIQPANNITPTDSLKCYTIYYDTQTLEIDTKDDRDYILVPTGGSNGQVLTATSSTAVAWQSPSGGDVVVSSQPNNILTSGMKIWAGTETNYGNLGTYDSNCLYLVIE